MYDSDSVHTNTHIICINTMYSFADCEISAHNNKKQCLFTCLPVAAINSEHRGI